MQLLSSEHMNVVDQAVWALGNIAGNGSDCRDFTIRCGIIQPLIELISRTTGVGAPLYIIIIRVSPPLPLSLIRFLT